MVQFNHEQREAEDDSRRLFKTGCFGVSGLVRDTVIEEYHARGSLSQADMKAFNKEVANKIYTYYRFNLCGTEAEKKALFDIMRMFHPTDWDEPCLDEDLTESVRYKAKQPPTQ